MWYFSYHCDSESRGRRIIFFRFWWHERKIQSLKILIFHTNRNNSWSMFNHKGHIFSINKRCNLYKISFNILVFIIYSYYKLKKKKKIVLFVRYMIWAIHYLIIVFKIVDCLFIYNVNFYFHLINQSYLVRVFFFQ